MPTRTTFRALLATAAVLGAAVVAAPACAAVINVSVTSMGDPNALPAGQQLIADFNDSQHPEATLLPGYTLQLDGSTVGVDEGVGGYSGALPNDPHGYLTIPTNGTATLFAANGLKSFSFYMGSADWYNSVHFYGDNGFDEVRSGGQMTQGYVGQSWDWGARVNFDFGDARVTKIVLSSSGNSFELDNLAGRSAAVPEPATWAMMILGFGAAGAMLRSRRRQAFNPA